MNHFPTRRALISGFAALTLFGTTTAQAHGFRAGDIEIAHPYAVPTPPGAVNGAAYVVKLENGGSQPDRLLRVATPAASGAEVHTMSVDAGGVMRMREVGEIVVAPGAPVRMRPGQGLHIMLVGLKKPLKEGDRFPMTMVFQRGGSVEVEVVVQAPKAEAEGGDHMH